MDPLLPLGTLTTDIEHIYPDSAPVIPQHNNGTCSAKASEKRKAHNN
jgi:hypothetical protein